MAIIISDDNVGRNGGNKNNSRFKVKSEQTIGLLNFMIVVDSITGVNYICTQSYEDGVSMTPLLGADGKVVVDR